MAGLSALQHRADTRQWRAAGQEIGSGQTWSARRRLASLFACLLFGWALVFVPFLIWG